MNTHIKVTVGIIVKNEKVHIQETLHHIFQLEYPKEEMEVLIVDGNSTDGTRDMISRFITMHCPTSLQVRLLREPWEKGSHGKARNFLADNARGAYVAFTDADCIVDTLWLKILMERMQEEQSDDDDVVAVGGIRLPVETTVWKEDLINNMMATFFGSGGSRGFMSTDERYVDSVPNYNAIYRTDTIRHERYGTLGVGEDYEFNVRLNQKGKKIAFEQKAIVYHHQENSILGFLSQMKNYGIAQAAIFKSIKKIRYFALIAPVFIIFLIFGGVFSLYVPAFMAVYVSIVGLYIVIDLYYTCTLLFTSKKIYSLCAFPLFFTQHISYGIGVLIGIFKKI